MKVLFSVINLLIAFLLIARNNWKLYFSTMYCCCLTKDQYLNTPIANDVVSWVIFGLDDGLTFTWHQALIHTNAGIMYATI